MLTPESPPPSHCMAISLQSVMYRKLTSMRLGDTKPTRKSGENRLPRVVPLNCLQLGFTSRRPVRMDEESEAHKSPGSVRSGPLLILKALTCTAELFFVPLASVGLI